MSSHAILPILYIRKQAISTKTIISTIARHEVKITLAEVLISANRLLKEGGRLAMVHRTDRLIDVLDAFRKYGIEPKRLRFVYPKQSSKESLIILLEGMKSKAKGILKSFLRFMSTTKTILIPTKSWKFFGTAGGGEKVKRQKSFANDNAKLYIVSTPIGNLEDITLRAINTLKTVDLIYCEDTRNTVKLLNHYDIKTKMKSFHLFNENEITSEVIGQIKNGLNIALVSDAGSPCISDPGWILVSEAIRNDIDVIVVPGVVAGITALVASGLSTERFTFYGFLSSKQKKRTEELKELKNRTETVILYEAPHRIKATLEDIDAIMPERQIVLARELTKKFEEYSRGTAREILEELDVVKGEMYCSGRKQRNRKGRRAD